ncbi:MAG: filamentous hemagglutinin N-terminal domain-containing protein [Burkholderiales bacterium]
MSQSVGSVSARRRRDGTAFAFEKRLLAAAVSSAFAVSSFANPSGGAVAAGNATFVVNGKTLTVTNTPGTIINWQQFSISQDEITRFIQQNAASAVLNRVVGQDPTQILGKLLSNGRVFLVNPNGIVFGQGAMIDVAGFAASTLRMSDADFLSGRTRFEGTGAEGKLTNLGTIRTVEGGHVYLVAPNVENGPSGVITSPKGEVVIAAGKTVELVNARTPDIRVEFTAPQGEAVNAGEVVASGGHIGIYGSLVKNSGLVSASRAVVGDGGKIVLKAVKDVTLDASSRIEANGANGGSIEIKAETGTLLAQGTIEAKGDEAEGGDIKLLGNGVAVSNAVVDASGKTGGGTVLIGGDFQGANPAVQNAQRTIVTQTATVKADATAKGDGGKVIVWADGDTRFHGSITVRGGVEGGDGGFVEVSGKEVLAFRGSVDTRAPLGRTGELLLDPGNISITAGSTPNANFSADTGDGLWAFVEGGTSESVGATEIVAILNNTNLTLQASNNIVLETNADIDYSNSRVGAEFTLEANNSIEIQSGANIRSTNGALSITLHADNNADGAGSVSLAADSLLQSAGGNISLIGADVAIAANATVSAGSGAISLRPGVASTQIEIGAGAANFSIDATEAQRLFANLLTLGSASQTGNITVVGAANFTNVAAVGQVRLLTSTGAVRFDEVLASPANVRIDTTAGGASAGNILFNGSGAISAAGKDVILVTRDGAGGPAGMVDVLAGSATNVIASSLNITTGSGIGNTQDLRTDVASVRALINLDNSGNASIRNAITNNGSVSVDFLENRGGGDLNFTVTNGNFTLSNGQVRSYGTSRITASGDILFNSPSQANPAFAEPGANGFTSNVILSAGGSIDVLESAGANTTTTIKATSATLTSGAGIGATNAVRTDVTNLTLNNTASGTVNVREVDAVSIVSAAITGNLNLIAGGAITQGSGNIVVSGAATFNAGTTNDITLGNTTNDFANVTIAAARNVSIKDANALRLNGAAFAGGLTLETLGAAADLTIAGDNVYSGGGANTASFLSARNVLMESGSNIRSTGGALNVTLNADTDQGTSADGGVQVGAGGAFANITTAGGNVLIGGNASAAGSAIGTAGTANIGVRLNNANISAGAGNVTIRGQGTASSASADGVRVESGGSSITTTTGSILIQGNAGAGATTQSFGVYLNTSVSITAAGGGITITGNGTSGAGAKGIFMRDASVIESTGAGDITLTGFGGTGANSEGITIGSGGGTGPRVTTTSTGNITITGTSGSTAGTDAYGVSITNRGSKVESTGTGGGSITITGNGGSGADRNYGVFMQGAVVRSEDGAIVINATSSGTGTDNHGLYLNNETAGPQIAAVIESTGTANLTVNATAGTGGVGIKGIGAVATEQNRLGNTAATGTVTLVSDTMDLNSTKVQSGSTITLRPTTASREIELGAGAEETTKLGLAGTELTHFNAPNVVIGGASQTGNISVVGAANFANVGAGGTLTLQTLGSANLASNLASAGNVTLTAASGIAFTQSGVTGVTTGAGRNATLTAANGAIASASSATDVSTGGATGAVSLTANQGIGALGANNEVSLNTGNVNATNNGPATVTGDIVIVNATGLNLGGTGVVTNNASAGNIQVTVTAGDLLVGNTLATSGGGAVTLSATAGNVAFATANGVTGISTTGNATLNATAGRVIGNTNGNASTSDVSATRLTINSANGIGDANALRTASVANLAINNTVDGNVNIVNGGAALNLDSTTVGSGNLSIANSTHITQTGNIVMGAGTTATFNATTAGDITLDSLGNNFTSLTFTGGAVSIRENSATELANESLASTSLLLTSNGALTDTGNVVVSGNANFQAGTNAITLDSLGNNFTSLTFTGGAVSIRENSATELANESLASTSLLLTSNGALTDTGTVVVNGNANF